MAKAKKPLFEQMVFNDVQYAKDTMAICEEKLARNKTALYIAAGGTLCTVLSFLLTGTVMEEIFVWIAICASIVSYIIGGGIKIALSWTWKICKFGWFIIPIFPIDIVAGIGAFIVAVFAFFLVPIVCVWLNRRQISKDYEAAKQYLSYCAPVGNENEENDEKNTD